MKKEGFYVSELYAIRLKKRQQHPSDRKSCLQTNKRNLGKNPLGTDRTENQTWNLYGNRFGTVATREPPVLYPAVEREPERSLWVGDPGFCRGKVMPFRTSWISIARLFIFGFDGSRFKKGSSWWELKKNNWPVGHLVCHVFFFWGSTKDGGQGNVKGKEDGQKLGRTLKVRMIFWWKKPRRDVNP